MVQPNKRQLDDLEMQDWNLNSIIGYVLRNNGVFVTFCILLICFQVYDKRERDIQMMALITSNGKILSEVSTSLASLTKAVTENDTRDRSSIEKMNPAVTNIETSLHEIKQELQRKQ